MRKFKVNVKALWFDKNVGLEGFYGGILLDGTPVALCSAEKWDMGLNDSLRRGWIGDIRIGDKSFYMDISEEELRSDGLLIGSPLQMQVPIELLPYLVR